MIRPPVGLQAQLARRSLPYPPPPTEAIRRVYGALRADKTADARRYAEQLPRATAFEQAWNAYIHGLILVEEGDRSDAKDMARHAASAALTLGLSQPQNPEALRL